MIIVALVVALYGGLYLYSVDLTQNIYIAALLCICLLLLIVFCADMTSVTAVMLWMVTCGCGDGFWSKVKQSTTVPHIIFYPLLVFLTPIIFLLLKFRAIFPHNWFIKSQKIIMSLGEAAWEASPQLTLQIFIVLMNIDQPVSKLQLTVIFSSSLTLVIPAIEAYLQRNGDPAKLMDIFSFFPLFFIMNIFKILSICILLVFFTFPWTILLLLLSGTVYFFVSLIVYFCIDGTGDDVYAANGAEAAFQGWIRLTNLDVLPDKEEDKPDPNPVHRRASSIFYLFLYCLPLLVILVCCNTNPDVYIFDLSHWNYTNWRNLSLVKLEHGVWCNTIILTTMGIGVMGVVLDGIYSCFGKGVFYFSKE